MSTRNLILIFSEGAMVSGNFEHVLRWRRNSVTRLDAISAFADAGGVEAVAWCVRGQAKHHVIFDGKVRLRRDEGGRCGWRLQLSICLLPDGQRRLQRRLLLWPRWR